MALTDDRYSRQVLLKEIGQDGQAMIGSSHAVVVGCGALGTHSASLLVRAGVGKVTLIDRDVIELSNLQRQTLFEEGDVGRRKAEVAEERLRRVNQTIMVDGVVADLTPDNAEQLVEGATVVVDATDNMSTRFVVNDACVKLGIPWVYGGAVGVSGMVFSTVRDGPCFRCIFPRLPDPDDLPTCNTVGIVNTLPSTVASLQVTEAIKIMLGETPSRCLMVLDIWSPELQMVKVSRNPECRSCGKREFYHYGR